MVVLFRIGSGQSSTGSLQQLLVVNKSILFLGKDARSKDKYLPNYILLKFLKRSQRNKKLLKIPA